MLWVPLTIWAGFAQTLRNAAQRTLIADLGTLGATLVRFLYGLPFAALWLVIVLVASGASLPSPTWMFVFWVVIGAVSQIAATALVLRVMTERNFTLGVAYSKTELVQVGVFGLVFLGDELSALTIVAIVLATVGVLFLSPADKDRPIRGLLAGITTPAALFGIASGAGLALAAVGYRGAALELDRGYLAAAAYTLLWAQVTQTVLLGGWLLVKDAKVIVRTAQLWHASMVAGFMGAAASVGWLTAVTLEPAAHVRTLGLVELFFSIMLSRRMFQERLRVTEVAGIILLVGGMVAILLDL